jgi:hypothetical protein
MIVFEQYPKESLSVKKFGYVGFGYRQLKYASFMGARLYGDEDDRAYKNPSLLECKKLRQRLRDIELASTSHIHSNRDVYLQRIRKYAVKLSISHDFCKMGVL